MTSQVWRVRVQRALLVSFLVALASSGSHACVGRHTLAARDMDGLGPAIAWFSPGDKADTRTLDSWRMSVGPPVVLPGTVTGPATVDSLTLVSWNTAIGAGDVERLVRRLRRDAPDRPIVLLLQEVYRGGSEVPALLAPAAAYASRLTGQRVDGHRDEIETIASRLGMSAYYVPSMRNGAPLLSDEDRGNAIVSTLPLTELTAFELPFERQRRVAVGATLQGVRSSGEPWTLRVVSTHLDNMSGLRRLWVASEFGRVRQVRGLIGQLDRDTSLVLGGDFNTWFGFADQAFRETARAFPGTRVTDRRATFLGILRLDHLFFRLPNGWSAQFRRADETYGSDHYPLIARIDVQ